MKENKSVEVPVVQRNLVWKCERIFALNAKLYAFNSLSFFWCYLRLKTTFSKFRHNKSNQKINQRFQRFSMLFLKKFWFILKMEQQSSRFLKGLTTTISAAKEFVFLLLKITFFFAGIISLCWIFGSIVGKFKKISKTIFHPLMN